MTARAATVAFLATLAAVLVSLPAPTGADRPPPRLPMEHVVDVRLPGSASRFDYQAIDPVRNRLFIAHLGASQVDVVNLGTLGIAGVVKDVAEVHGVRVAPDLGTVYASATRDDAVVAFDASTLTTQFRAMTGAFPDGLAYDPDDSTVFVSDKTAGNLTSIDAASGQRTRTVKVGDETGNVAYDGRSRTVFVAARTPDQIAGIAPETGAVSSRVRLSGCSGAHGVYLEPAARLAFVACERNARVSVVDLRTMTQLSTQSTGKDPDVLAYDPGLGRLYVASESGVVAVFEVRGSSLVKLGQAKLADHAHSVAVDPVTHRIFFPLQAVRGRPVLRVMRPTGT